MKRTPAAYILLTLLLCVTAGAQEPVAEKAQKSGAVSYGLVVDNSGSVRTLLDRVIAVVSDVVEDNTSEDEVFLVTFVDTAKIVLRQEFTTSKSEIHDAAQNMFVEGGQTAILDAVKISADYLVKNARTEGGRSRALVVITDGDDRDSGSKLEDVLRLLKENNIRVFVIAMADGKVVTKLIDRLTKESGGTKYSPKTKSDLVNTANQISAAIRAK